MKFLSIAALFISVTACGRLAAAADIEKSWKPVMPKVWDEAALAGWITPVAGLNVRPAHLTAAEYYAIPEYNLRTYPVYVPGREPHAYWEMLQPLVRNPSSNSRN